MDEQLKKMTGFFKQLGVTDVNHTKGTYLGHAAGVYSDLKKWGCNDDMCRAGMFHSLYGTQKFQKVALPLDRRPEVRAVIGDRAEQLAFWNCFMERTAFDQTIFQDHGPYYFVDRATGERTELSEQDLADLMTLHLCDWLEQVPRSQQWDYRRAAYRQMAQRLGGVALAAYERVFSMEAAAAANAF